MGISKPILRRSLEIIFFIILLVLIIINIKLYFDFKNKYESKLKEKEEYTNSVDSLKQISDSNDEEIKKLKQKY